MIILDDLAGRLDDRTLGDRTLPSVCILCMLGMLCKLCMSGIESLLSLWLPLWLTLWRERGPISSWSRNDMRDNGTTWRTEVTEYSGTQVLQLISTSNSASLCSRACNALGTCSTSRTSHRRGSPTSKPFFSALSSIKTRSC